MYLSADQATTISEDLTLGAHGVVWKFIPKKVPWFGGSGKEDGSHRTDRELFKESFRQIPLAYLLQMMIVGVKVALNDRPLTGGIDDPQCLHTSCMAGR